jgi:uncharacterized protein (TIGR02147 family)
MKGRSKSPADPDEYLKANLERARKALRAVPRDRRDISAVTVSLSRQAAEQVRWEFRDMRKRILELAKTDEKPERIYQFNLQFFPVSE